MAPSLFNASRLPASRTLPAPSALGPNIQTNLQRRGITTRAHNPVRLAVVDALSTSASSAQVHSSSDEEDGAHSGSRILVTSEPSTSSSSSSETAAGAAAAGATTLEAEPTRSPSSMSRCSPPAAAPAAIMGVAAASGVTAPEANKAVAAPSSATPTTTGSPTPTTSTNTGNTATVHPSSSSGSNSLANQVVRCTSDADVSSVAADWSGSHAAHNAVTIKENTNVKDAAGAVVKVLSRLPNVLVTALRMEQCHDSLNRAVKSIAVARKYVTDEQPDRELTFLPVNRSGATGCTDPNLFAFLCFKIQMAKGIHLLEQDKTDLNVSRGSNANAMANAIIRILKERGQAVMKAGGSEAIFIAMSAVINARFRLKRSHNMDAMVVPAWITEDTCNTLGRESKFLRLNILPCSVNGPFNLIPA